MNILRDSRLRESKGTVMADWALPDGSTVRIEVEPCYCVGCGKLGIYVPKENTVAATYICNDCYRKDPGVFTGFVGSDEQFCRDVGFEMMERFGRTLTEPEIVMAAQGNTLGPALEALCRDSPFPALDNRPGR